MAEIAAAAPAKGEAKFRRLEWFAVSAVVIFVVALSGLAIYAGAGQVLNHLQHLPAGLIAAMLGLALFNYACRSWRWHVFSRGLGLKIPPGANTLYFVSGFALTASPGKAGEALRVWLIERCHGYAYQRTLPLFLGDRMSDMIAILVLCLVGVGAFAQADPLYLNGTLVVAALMVAMVALFLRPALLLSLVNRLWGLMGKRAPRLFAKIRTTIRDTRRLLTVRLFGFGMLLAIAGWLAEIYAFQLLVQELGLPITLTQAAFIFTFAMIAGTISMMPGGLGGAEATLLALLALLGLDFDRAVVATAVIRLATLWFATGLGFIALPIALRRARRGRAT